MLNPGTRLRLAGLLLVLFSLSPDPGLADDDDKKSKQEDREKAKQVRRIEKALKDAMKRGDLDGVAMQVQELGSVGTNDALDTILSVGEKYPGEPVRSAVFNTLQWSRHNEASMRHLLFQIIRTRSVHRALLIVEAFQVMDHPVALEGLIEALDFKDPRVVAAAVRALRKKPTPKVVEAVIELYKKVGRREDLLAVETRITLVTLTSQDYQAYEDWEKWWSINKSSWKPQVDVSKGEPAARTAVYRPRPEVAKLPQLFGQEVASKRVTFVIDTSQSMQKSDPGAGHEGGFGSSRIRIDRAKSELLRVVSELRSDVLFNIVAYSTGVYPWQERLVPANRVMKQRALEFVQALEPAGFTSTGDALLTALGYPECDTVILLSDGSPTLPDSGDVVDERGLRQILEDVQEANRFKKIAIHTLGFRGAKVSFMKALAAQNDGTYAPIE